MSTWGKKKFHTCLVSHKNSVIKVKLVQYSRMPLNRLKYVRSSVGVSSCVGSKTHLSLWSVTNNCQQHTAREEKMSMSNRQNILMTQGLLQPEEMLDFHLYWCFFLPSFFFKWPLASTVSYLKELHGWIHAL